MMRNNPHARQFSVRGFIALCWFIYFASYLTRQNYAAALTPMLADFQFPKPLLSMAATGSSITYGIGQLLCGLALRKISAKQMMLTGLSVSAVCNWMIALLGTFLPLPQIPYAFLGVWCVNGFAQAMLWPSLLQTMAQQLNNEDYKRACVHVTVASSFATVFVYLLVPFTIQVGNWRWAFPICAGLSLVVILFAAFLLPNTAARNENPIAPSDAKPIPMRRMLFGIGLLPLLLGVVLHGILRDGVSTWMPVLIAESFPAFSQAKSVLTAAILPLFAALSIQIAGRIGRKIHHETRTAALFFAIAFLCAAVLPFAVNRSVAANIILMALITSCMHGVNLMIICQLPARFAAHNSMGFAAGVINACTYVGSAVSIFGIAWTADRFGWKVTAVIWTCIALAGTIIFLLSVGKINNFLQLQNKSHISA
ncbi:MAG: MFS transporter [Oscillospiraceae bacterium]|jgi:OPA family glycerol-3-phosphate transporter-like MFS transporter|nr:MFS transporter [Oscillospiraceae bacterium]